MERLPRLRDPELNTFLWAALDRPRVPSEWSKTPCLARLVEVGLLTCEEGQLTPTERGKEIAMFAAEALPSVVAPLLGKRTESVDDALAAGRITPMTEAELEQEGSLLVDLLNTILEGRSQGVRWEAELEGGHFVLPERWWPGMGEFVDRVSDLLQRFASKGWLVGGRESENVERKKDATDDGAREVGGPDAG